MTLSKALRLFVPPIFFRVYERLTSIFKDPMQGSSGPLFDGDDSLFRHALSNAKTYGEYGCGASTDWVLKHTELHVLSVDSSAEWVAKVAARHGDNPRLNLHHVDLGPLITWGRPADYSRRDSFDLYSDWLWQQPQTPEVVLIDGRFRVRCFLTTLKFAAPGTRIVFDDYIDRPYYHFVENFVERNQVCGRQCLFIVPSRETLDIDAIDREIVNFRHVID